MHWTENLQLIDLLKRGGVAVMPSDTIYGISTNALNQAAVDRIFDIKLRHDSSKTVITLCSSVEQLQQRLAEHQQVEHQLTRDVLQMEEQLKAMIEKRNLMRTRQSRAEAV